MASIRKWLWAHERVVLLFLVVGLFGAVYFGAAALPPWTPRMLLGWDPVWSVPYFPVFILPYCSVFPMPLAVLACIRDRHRFRRTALAMSAAILASGVCFLALPLLPPRPPDPGAGAFGALAAFVWRLDVPTNLFPSLHVSIAFLTAFAVGRERPRSRPWMLAWAALIAVSTLFVRQHYAIDVAGGIAIALICARLLAPRPVA